MDAGPHRDLSGDLTAAVKKEGLHMGFYYSLYEWFNPLYHGNLEKYVDDHMIPQMNDLVKRQHHTNLIRQHGEPVTDDTRKSNSAEMGFFKHGFCNQAALYELHQCRKFL